MRKQLRVADSTVGSWFGVTAFRGGGLHCFGGEKPVELVGPFGSECVGAAGLSRRSDQSTLVFGMGIGFLRGDQGGAYPHAVSAGPKCSGCSAAIGYAACCQHEHVGPFATDRR